MAVSYQQLLHSTALRINALVGTQFAALETTYATATLTAANFRSADWPFSSFRDAILMAVGEFVAAICETGNRPERAAFESTTIALGNAAAIPATDSGGVNKIIGPYGAVTDASDSNALTEQPVETVRRLVREYWRIFPLYYYAINGGRIYTTRPNVVIRVATYSRSVQETLWNSGGNMPLADHHEAGVVARALSHMAAKHTLLSDGVMAYRELGDQALIATRAGITSVTNKVQPTPPPIATAT